jgi:hypothetical protein
VPAAAPDGNSGARGRARVRDRCDLHRRCRQGQAQLEAGTPAAWRIDDEQLAAVGAVQPPGDVQAKPKPAAAGLLVGWSGLSGSRNRARWSGEGALIRA